MISQAVLIIDDEREILDLLETVLKREGFSRVFTADGAKAGLDAFKTYEPDVVLLDIMLPDGNGFDVFKAMQQIRPVPVLFISAKDEEVDRLLGFAIGAQDYITKPFSPKEVAYRVKARLQSAPLENNVKLATNLASEIRFGDIVIDTVAGEVRKGTQTLDFSAKEFKLLYYLASHPNRILTKEQICQAVWGEDFVGFDNTISVHIRKLRLKIEVDPSKPLWIQTVIGLGYKFVNRKELASND